MQNLHVADDVLDGVVGVENVNMREDAREHVHGAPNRRNGHLLAAGTGNNQFAGRKEQRGCFGLVDAHSNCRLPSFCIWCVTCVREFDLHNSMRFQIPRLQKIKIPAWRGVDYVQKANRIIKPHMWGCRCAKERTKRFLL